ncbi:MAG: YbgC/FadM family acyl-CoA thioesterase [Spirochaetales bacterium]|nr:YbgC/FadM family acyl-CoA thioesterase [Spirochaetales bacterium]
MKTNLCGYIENNLHYLPVRVYFSDTDAGGVIYHAKYLDMAEHARTELLMLLGIDHSGHLKAKNECFVVRTVKIDYITPGFLEEELVIRTKMVKQGKFSLEMVQEVVREDTVLARLDLKLGFISLSTGRPSPIPSEWAAELHDIYVSI